MAFYMAGGHPQASQHDICTRCWDDIKKKVGLDATPQRVPLAANCAIHEVL